MLSNAKKCYLCGSTESLTTHHIFNAYNRNNSEKYKDTCTCYLCMQCHYDIHNKDKNTDRVLKRHAQHKTMEKQKWSMEDWLKVFKKSYI